MRVKSLPSAAYLRSALDYDHEAGAFTWRHREDAPNSWNAYFPGRPAGSIKPDGYLYISLSNLRFMAHRLAWKMAHGEDPPHEIDHINGDRSDNRLHNLRSCTRAENQKNKSAQRNNTSGAMGVTFNKSEGRWRAYIKINGRHKQLGTFDDFEAAVFAREIAEDHFGFHRNHGRQEPVKEAA